MIYGVCFRAASAEPQDLETEDQEAGSWASMAGASMASMGGGWKSNQYPQIHSWGTMQTPEG